MSEALSSHDLICDRISEGESLHSLCKEFHVSTKTIYQRILEDTAFGKRYAQARAQQAEYYADDIVNIADTETDPQKARVRVDARKWVAAKLLPKKYGDQPMTNTVQVNVAIISTEKQQALQERRRKLLED